MTILPKKKQQPGGSHQQQQQQQQPQQDGRHQQHASGNIGDSSVNTGGGGGSLLNSSANVPTVGSSAASVSSTMSTSTPMSPFLSTSAMGAAISTLPSPHHGGDAASAVSLGGGVIGSGSGINSVAGGIRRPIASAHLACHDANDAGEGGVLLGPHRKRTAVASVSTTGASGLGASSSARSAQNDRSSPYRTTRRSNRGGGGGAILANASPISVSTSPTSMASTMNSVGVYNASGTVAAGVAVSAAAAHNSRGNLSPSEARDDEGGYNSEDEYERVSYYGDNATVVPEEIERKFEETLLATKGFRVKKMQEDGACLFRAVADQVYGDEEMHAVVRKLCMDYMAKNADYFNQFVTEDFAAYIERKRQDFVHGNHVEIQAMAELFNRPIQVYQYTCEPINTFHSPHETDNPAIRVSYHDNHYNSVVDPYAATIGVGLGLPQFYPGLAEKNLMRDAVHASEQDAIEEAMLEDKLRVTDWEATDEQLQEQVARESYLQWIRDQEKQMKENAATRGGVSTTTTNPVASRSQSPDHARPSCSKSPNRVQVNEAGDTASASVAGSSRFYGTKRWDDDDDLLKQVMALSQQEYFDSLRNQRQEDSDKKPSSSSAPS